MQKDVLLFCKKMVCRAVWQKELFMGSCSKIICSKELLFAHTTISGARIPRASHWHQATWALQCAAACTAIQWKRSVNLQNYTPENFDIARSLLKKETYFGWALLQSFRYAQNPPYRTSSSYGRLQHWCIAVYCSVLQCVAVWCNVFQSGPLRRHNHTSSSYRVAREPIQIGFFCKKVPPEIGLFCKRARQKLDFCAKEPCFDWPNCTRSFKGGGFSTRDPSFV